ncbi:hypothetical protein [Serratia microhaemolytica]|uniref:hypothetical protein n=1 Tax=Serratia microhaemolytica TaxID=2675110 RepID=UPI001F0C54C7|nr:hypothetical protein [Serratia microhaemolytica]
MTVQDTVGMVYGAKAAGVGLGSLAKATAPTKLAPDPTIRQRVLENIAKSKAARESSGFLRAQRRAEARNMQQLIGRARQNLLDEINQFSSKNQAGKVATIVAAYDSTTGKIAVGNSNARISAETLHPKTVIYVEKQLGVKIGEFTSFCKNRVGTCAEVSAADQLIRQGVEPSRIQFTEALRPRDMWKKDEILPDAIIPPCPNCSITWPKRK